MSRAPHALQSDCNRARRIDLHHQIHEAHIYSQLERRRRTEQNDDIGLDLTIRAPTNATGYKFNFKFHSFEFGEYVCTSFNDQFIALVNPPPMGSQNRRK